MSFQLFHNSDDDLRVALELDCKMIEDNRRKLGCSLHLHLASFFIGGIVALLIWIAILVTFLILISVFPSPKPGLPAPIFLLADRESIPYFMLAFGSYFMLWFCANVTTMRQQIRNFQGRNSYVISHYLGRRSGHILYAAVFLIPLLSTQVLTNGLLNR